MSGQMRMDLTSPSARSKVQIALEGSDMGSMLAVAGMREVIRAGGDSHSRKVEMEGS